MPAEVHACADPRWAPVNDYWSYDQIAAAFYVFGVAPWNFPQPNEPSLHVEDCVAALTIVAGECSPGTQPAKGCSASGSGASGVFQTDFLRTVPGYPSESVMPLCASAYGAGYMAAPFFADSQATKASTLSYAGGTAAAYYTCAGAPRYVNNYTACPDPAAQPAIAYPNFIGPFCHKAYSMRWSSCAPATSCCSLFNGGANAGQPPFPQYYSDKAAEAEAATGAAFRAVCQEAASASAPPAAAAAPTSPSGQQGRLLL